MKFACFTSAILAVLVQDQVQAIELTRYEDGYDNDELYQADMGDGDYYDDLCELENETEAPPGKLLIRLFLTSAFYQKLKRAAKPAQAMSSMTIRTLALRAARRG